MSSAHTGPWAKAKRDRRVLTPDEAWAEDIDRQILAVCHPAQLGGVLDLSKRITLLTGRGAGKTSTKRARGVRKLVKKRRAKVLYFAKTRGHAEDLMWTPLKEMLEQLRIEATFNETKLRCVIHRTGSIYQLAGADDKGEIEKWRGQSFDEVQIDEGASHQTQLLEYLIYRIIGPRLGDKDGCIIIGGTPGHILDGLFYETTRPGSKLHRPWDSRELEEFAGWKGWSSHHWSLKQVSELPDAARLYPALVALWREALEEKARNQWSDDNPIWRREYLGEWAADDTDNIFRYRAHVDGQPWNQWDPERVGPLRLAKLPEGIGDWHYVIAMDEGYKDPFACNAFAFSPRDPGRNFFHVFAFERVKMFAKTISELLQGEEATAAVMAGRSPGSLGGLIGALGWPDAMIADADEALLAELSNVYGLRIAKAEKNANYKQGAISLCNGDLVDGRAKILKGSPLEIQLQSLQYRIDETTRMMREDKAQANHSSDTFIYGRRALAELFSGDEPPKKSPKARTVDAVYVDSQGLDPAGPRNGSRSREDFEAFTVSGTFDDSWG